MVFLSAAAMFVCLSEESFVCRRDGNVDREGCLGRDPVERCAFFDFRWSGQFFRERLSCFESGFAVLLFLLNEQVLIPAQCREEIGKIRPERVCSLIPVRRIAIPVD